MSQLISQNGHYSSQPLSPSDVINKGKEAFPHKARVFKLDMMPSKNKRTIQIITTPDAKMANNHIFFPDSGDTPVTKYSKITISKKRDSPRDNQSMNKKSLSTPHNMTIKEEEGKVISPTHSKALTSTTPLSTILKITSPSGTGFSNTLSASSGVGSNHHSIAMKSLGADIRQTPKSTKHENLFQIISERNNDAHQNTGNKSGRKKEIKISTSSLLSHSMMPGSLSAIATPNRGHNTDGANTNLKFTENIFENYYRVGNKAEKRSSKEGVPIQSSHSQEKYESASMVNDAPKLKKALKASAKSPYDTTVSTLSVLNATLNKFQKNMKATKIYESLHKDGHINLDEESVPKKTKALSIERHVAKSSLSNNQNLSHSRQSSVGHHNQSRTVGTPRDSINPAKLALEENGPLSNEARIFDHADLTSRKTDPAEMKKIALRKAISDIEIKRGSRTKSLKREEGNTRNEQTTAKLDNKEEFSTTGDVNKGMHKMFLRFKKFIAAYEKDRVKLLEKNKELENEVKELRARLGMSPRRSIRGNHGIKQ